MNWEHAGASDAELVEQARAHDQQAFGAIYDRYADEIYTFCRSRLRNEADAADAMQETFVRATTRFGQLRQPDKLRSWLFAIARNQVITTGKLAARATGGDAVDDVIDLRAEVDGDLLRAEASAELWDAAGGLSERDQDVLELHVRHGLSGQALADVIGVTESHANVLVSRMKDRIATALGSLLVARSGRSDCDELDLLLVGWDGTFTIDMRSKITRHIRACDFCERTQGAALAAGAFMLPVLEVPADLRGSTIEMMAEAAGLSAAGSAAGGRSLTKLEFAAAAQATTAADVWDWRADGFPFPDEENAIVVAPSTPGTSAWLASAAAFLLVLLLGAGAWFVFGQNDDATVAVAGISETAATVPSTGEAAPSSTVAAETSTTTTADSAAAPVDEPETELATPVTELPATTEAPATTESPATTSSSTTSEPPETTTVAPTTTTAATTTTTSSTTTSTSSTTTTSTSTTTSTTTTSTSTTTTPTTEAPPPPPNRAPVIRSVDASPLGVTVRSAGCTGDSTQVVVEFVDDGEIISVVASWSPGPGSFSEVALLPRTDSVYTGAVGPWTETGPQQITIVVTDDQGETATGQGSVRVTACAIGDFAG